MKCRCTAVRPGILRGANSERWIEQRSVGDGPRYAADIRYRIGTPGHPIPRVLLLDHADDNDVVGRVDPEPPAVHAAPEKATRADGASIETGVRWLETGRLVAEDPLNLLGRSTYGASLFFARDFERAAEEWSRLLDIDPSFPKVIQALSVAKSCRAGITNRAFACLEEAYRYRQPLLLLANVQPRMDCLRADPRLQEMLARLNLLKPGTA